MFCLYNVGRQQTSMSRNDIILISSDATALACLVDEENAVEA